MTGEHVELHERTGVEQQLEPLAREQLALLVLTLDRLAAGVQRLLAQLVELLEAFLDRCATGGTGVAAPPSPCTSGSSTAIGLRLVVRLLRSRGRTPGLRLLVLRLFPGGQAGPEPGGMSADHRADDGEQATDDDEVRADRDEVADTLPEVRVVDDLAHLVHVQEAGHDHRRAEKQPGDLPPGRERHRDDEQLEHQHDDPEADPRAAGTGARVDDELGRDGVPVRAAPSSRALAPQFSQLDRAASNPPIRTRERPTVAVRVVPAGVDGVEDIGNSSAPQGGEAERRVPVGDEQERVRVTRRLQRMTPVTKSNIPRGSGP